MKHAMTERIQSIIVAVQQYKKWYMADAMARGIPDIDVFEQTMKYYSSFFIPEGLEHNRACFEAILRYPIEQTLNTQMEDLPHLFKFEY